MDKRLIVTIAGIISPFFVNAVYKFQDWFEDWLIKGEGKRQKDNETVVLLTGRDYDYMAKVIKGENK